MANVGHIWDDFHNSHRHHLDYNKSNCTGTSVVWTTGATFIQIMVCRLLGAKPLPEPMLVYCQLDSWEQISVKFKSEFYHFYSRQCIWICHLPIWWPLCPGGDELNHRWSYIIYEWLHPTKTKDVIKYLWPNSNQTLLVMWMHLNI